MDPVTILLYIVAIPVALGIVAAVLWFIFKLFWIIGLIVFKLAIIALAIAALVGLGILLT
jgi:hypothetical protein